MERTYIADALKCEGKELQVRGFVDSIRNSKAMAFIVLKDITGRLQITVENDKHPVLCPLLDQITADSII